MKEAREKAENKAERRRETEWAKEQEDQCTLACAMRRQTRCTSACGATHSSPSTTRAR